MILNMETAPQASVALRKNIVSASLVAFHTNTLSRITASLGLPAISETVTGMPSGSEPSIVKSRVS